MRLPRQPSEPMAFRRGDVIMGGCCGNPLQLSSSSSIRVINSGTASSCVSLLTRDDITGGRGRKELLSSDLLFGPWRGLREARERGQLRGVVLSASSPSINQLLHYLCYQRQLLGVRCCLSRVECCHRHLVMGHDTYVCRLLRL